MAFSRFPLPWKLPRLCAPYLTPLLAALPLVFGSTQARASEDPSPPAAPLQNPAASAPAKADAQKDAAPEFVRITRDHATQSLETGVTHYSNAQGQKVSLFGAIHIADKCYYDALNKRFRDFNKVLYEMIGGENLPAEIRQARKDAAEGKNPQNLEHKKINGLSISDIYLAAAKKLNLTVQNIGIDYGAENLVHADMTHKEFEDAQKKQKESMLRFLLQGLLSSSPPSRYGEPDPIALTRALLQNDPDALKRELMKAMGSADTLTPSRKPSVILQGRNQKCLEVLDAQLAAKTPSCAIFYGAAHLPELHAELIKRGFKLESTEYLPAWSVKTPQR